MISSEIKLFVPGMVVISLSSIIIYHTSSNEKIATAFCSFLIMSSAAWGFAQLIHLSLTCYAQRNDELDLSDELELSESEFEPQSSLDALVADLNYVNEANPLYKTLMPGYFRERYWRRDGGRYQIYNGITYSNITMISSEVTLIISGMVATTLGSIIIYYTSSNEKRETAIRSFIIRSCTAFGFAQFFHLCLKGYVQRNDELDQSDELELSESDTEPLSSLDTLVSDLNYVNRVNPLYRILIPRYVRERY